jgi:Na+-transporting methylmalonyl-CoA/oxaloacetate decarboxylase beta subunit
VPINIDVNIEKKKPEALLLYSMSENVPGKISKTAIAAGTKSTSARTCRSFPIE